MSHIIARIEITQDDEGLVNVVGTGPVLKQKAFAYGLLELAKDIIRAGRKSGIEGATMSDLPRA